MRTGLGMGLSKGAVCAIYAFLGAGFSATSIADTALVEQASTPVRFSTMGRLIVSSAKDPEDPGSVATNLFLHENAVRADYAELGVGIRFSNRFTTDGPKDINSPFNLEKKWAQAEWKRWSLLAGDGYQELGRGLALSLFRDPVFGVDTTLEGASVRYRPEALDVSVFGGRINAAKVAVAINPFSSPVADRQVWLAGTGVTGNVTADSRVGGHYLLTLQRPLDGSSFTKRWHTAGVTLGLDNLAEGVDVYAESNVLWTESLQGRREPIANGYASYGAISYADLAWKTRLELKDYRKYYYDFRRPPTLEDDVVVTLNTQDVTAARLSVERRLGGPKSAVFGSYLGGDERQENAALHHAVTGFRAPVGARGELEGKVGYRWVMGKNDLAHLALKSKLGFGGGRAVELEYRKQYAHRSLDLTPTLEDRNALFLTYSFDERWNTALGYEYVPSNPSDAGRHFANVGGNYRSGPLTAKAFVGQTSGGTLCSGGVCRQVPPYTGAMLETSYSF